MLREANFIDVTVSSYSTIVEHCLTKWAVDPYAADNDPSSYVALVGMCLYFEAEDLGNFMASINEWDDRPKYAGKLEKMAMEHLLFVFGRESNFDLTPIKNNVLKIGRGKEEQNNVRNGRY